MDHHEDIRLLADPEFAESLLMNALFSKLHRALARLQCDDIAVSFPRCTTEPPALGNLLRLHGTKDALHRLHAEPWLHGMRDHVHIQGIRPVPDQVQYRLVKRVQSKSNPDRIRRRQMRRHGWSAEEAQRNVPESAARLLSLPYLQVDSGSTGRRFRLFIEHREAPGLVTGPFSAYGLSTMATIPWF